MDIDLARVYRERVLEATCPMIRSTLVHVVLIKFTAVATGGGGISSGTLQGCAFAFCTCFFLFYIVRANCFLRLLGKITYFYLFFFMINCPFYEFCV